MVVAIDGPAAAGKSTVARALAEALGYTYLDSGAMYRSVVLAGPTVDPASLDIAFDGDRVLLGGHDVTQRIRTAEVSEGASRVAANPSVREAMVAKQRELLADGDWVAEGRDIGTVVVPDAELKVFLTAAPEERARRRAAELGADLQAALAEQAIRDGRDSTRAASPLRPADDAVEVDTTGKSVDEVVDEIVQLVAGRAS